MYFSWNTCVKCKTFLHYIVASWCVLKTFCHTLFSINWVISSIYFQSSFITSMFNLLRISNYKISACFEQNINWTPLFKDHFVKFHGNFFVWRSEPFVYVIFPSANHINISGIRRRDHIEKSFEVLRKSFNIHSLIRLKQIDNLTLSGHIINFSNLFTLKNYLSERKNKLFSIKFNSSFFPAIYLKLYKKGTFVIFNSGYFNLIGLNNIPELQKQLWEFSVLIQNFAPCGEIERNALIAEK